MRAFLCHSSTHSDFVVAVASYLRKSLPDDVFFYEDPDPERPRNFVARIDEELGRCTVMVVFADREWGPWQAYEYTNFRAAMNAPGAQGERSLVICQLAEQLPGELAGLQAVPRIEVRPDVARARETAIRIAEKLGLPFDDDGLPVNPHLFSYEKHIIRHFARCAENEGGQLPEDLRDKQLGGCPLAWPRVPRLPRPHAKGADEGQGTIQGAAGEDLAAEQAQDEAADEERMVVAAALSEYHQATCRDGRVEGCMVQEGMCFPEAIRRSSASLRFPRRPGGLRVGIVVSGGIAPGINAVIDGIVQRHEQYASEGGFLGQLEVLGLRNGFLAFDDLQHSAYRLDKTISSAVATEGGAFLGTSRDRELFDGQTRRARLASIVAQLRAAHYDILYVIGGDGSMKAAHALWTVAEEEWSQNGGQRVSVVAVPKTMDNDILWVWQAFGFMSAVEKARQIIEHIGTEVESNPRLYVVQLFGSDSGFVVSHAVLASKGRLCDAALIPEMRFSMSKLAEHMRKKIRARGVQRVARNPWALLPGGLVVMAETAVPDDAMDYSKDPDVALTGKEQAALEEYCRLRDEKKRIQGQTNEHLRSAGLKIVSRVLARLLQDTFRKVGDPDWAKLRVFTNEPRHQLRAIPPSCTDIIFGNRLGTLAVDNAMAGFTDFMISQWLTEYVLVPLKLVVLGRKRIPDGMFWQSVRGKTDQDKVLTDREEDPA